MASSITFPGSLLTPIDVMFTRECSLTGLANTFYWRGPVTDCGWSNDGSLLVRNYERNYANFVKTVEICSFLCMPFVASPNSNDLFGEHYFRLIVRWKSFRAVK